MYTFPELCRRTTSSRVEDLKPLNAAECAHLSASAAAEGVATLTVVGSRDEAYGAATTRRLHQVLSEKHISNILLELPFGHHSDYFLAGTPSAQISIYVAERFLWTLLERAPAVAS